LERLERSGIHGQVVGSLSASSVGRDLDFVPDRSAANLARLDALLSDIAVGSWRTRLRRLGQGDDGPFHFLTTYGPLDLHQRDPNPTTQ